jgi:hypothetical protein
MKEKLFKSESESAVERLEKRLRDFQSLPFMRQIEREQAEAILERRQIAAEKIENLRKESEQEIPELQTILSKKKAEYQAAKDTFQNVERELREAKVKLSNRRFFFENAIAKQEQILIETSDSQIDEGIKFFQKRLEWLRGPGRISYSKGGSEKNLITMKTKTREESNLNSVHLALNYCKQAISALQEMKLYPEADIERIESMKSAIPDISVFETYTGERALEKGPSDNIFHHLPSARHLEYNLNKTKEKIEEYEKRQKKANAGR